MSVNVVRSEPVSVDQIEFLDGEDEVFLNRNGWHMVTLFRARKDSDGSSALNLAVERCKTHNRKAGIRTIFRDDHTYYEVWDLWR